MIFSLMVVRTLKMRADRLPPSIPQLLVCGDPCEEVVLGLDYHRRQQQDEVASPRPFAHHPEGVEV